MSAASELLTSQQEFIVTLQSAANSELSNAQTTANEAKAFANEEIIYNDATAPAAPSDVTISPPSFQDSYIYFPGDPGDMVDLKEIPPVGDGFDAPTFDKTFTAPGERSEPSELAVLVPGSPSLNINLAFPTAPNFIEPLTPTFLDHALPVKGDTSVEKFNAVAPSDIPTAPTDYAARYKINYKDNAVSAAAMASDIVDEQLAKINPQYSAQMAAIESQLTKYLLGGTGLNTQVEDAIYSRAREKMDVEAKRVQDAAFADAAARGFTLPTGALYSALARARQDAANNNAKSATDIAVAQAEMEQKNLQFAVTTSAALRKSMLDSTMSYMGSFVAINGQALQFAKNMLDADIEVYNAAVKMFGIRMEQYKTEATVYELKSRIALNAVEIYKAEIQAFSAVLGADKNKIEIYRGLIEAQSLSASLYKTKVEAIVSKASLEKIKVDLYQGQIQAYSATVQGKNAELEVYKAKLEGDLYKYKNFEAQVKVFESQTNAYKARLDGDIAKAKGIAENNDSIAKGYNAKLSGYEALVRGRTAELSGKVEVQKSKLTAFQGELQAALANAQNALASFKVQADVNLENAKGNLQAAVQKKTSGAAAFASAAQVHGHILEMYSGPAKAAASAMNGLASVNENL